MHAVCPFCSRDVDVGDDQRGLKLQCGRCGNTYRLPDRDGEPAVPIGRVGADGAVDAPRPPRPEPPPPPPPKPAPEPPPVVVFVEPPPAVQEDEAKPWLVFGACAGGVLLLLAVATILLHEHDDQVRPPPAPVEPAPPDDPVGPMAIAGRIVLRDDSGEPVDGAGLTVTLHRAGLTLGPYRADIERLRVTALEQRDANELLEQEMRALAATARDPAKAAEFERWAIDAHTFRDFAAAKLDRIRETHFMNDGDPLTPRELWELFFAAPVSVPAAYPAMTGPAAVEEAPLRRTLKETELARVRADAAGRYRFNELAPGDYFVHAMSITTERAVEWVVPAQVRQDRTTTLDLGYENAVRVVGRR